MRKLSFLAVSAMAAVMAIFVAGQARATNQSQAEIKALQERLMAAIRVKDYDAIMACYIPGEKLFVFDVVAPTPVCGRTSVQGRLEGRAGPIQRTGHGDHERPHDSQQWK
jgi:ketosteroid isomerase-like protein